MTSFFNGQINPHWKPLYDVLRHLPEVAAWLPMARDFEMLFEVECTLYLYEQLVPEPSNRVAREAWALISGYVIENLNNTPEKIHMCLLGRERLRYVRPASAWRTWLEWYFGLPENIRLYQPFQIEGKNVSFEAHISEVPARSQRMDAYHAILTADELAVRRRAPQEWAGTGTYTFYVDEGKYQVEISDAMARFAQTETPKQALPGRTHREPITIDMRLLLKTAEEIDRLEESARIPGHKWHERLSALHFTLVKDDVIRPEQQILSIEGVFHLVGALGAGKSTLIWVLTYHLARCGKHVTVMLHTVVEAIQMAAWLRSLGIAAAPAIGRDRDKHEQKYGLANAKRLRSERLFQPQPPDDPEFRWMPAPCALSGANTLPIPAGREPCHSLMDADGKFRRCPLMPVCPVHQRERDLVESQVWIVNPMSILYSSAPDGIGTPGVRLLEAIYRRSDLLIIDEADRVQVQWDSRFAPTRLLAGSEQAFLDRLHEQLAAASVGIQGRRKSTRAAFQAMIKNDSQAHTLSSAVFRLLGKAPALVKWISRVQMTNYGLFKRLSRELVKTLSPDMSAEQKTGFQKKLEQEFRRYWTKPLGRETGFLNTWVKNLVGGDVREKALNRELKNWLVERMGWSEKLTPRRHVLFRRLEFCITMAAMMARSNDIYDRLPWIQDEIEWDDLGGLELAEEITGLVPDPPPGQLLGVSLSQRQPGQSLGVFHSLQYRGVGRWLLLNFPRLYRDKTGLAGPHLLLTSATSWFPDAAQFHLAMPPHALLTSDVPAGTIEMQFKPVGSGRKHRLKVSGVQKYREQNLRQMVRSLAAGDKNNRSEFDHELDFWQQAGAKRRILLVVSSYEQAEWVLDELRGLPEWAGRVRRLLRDDGRAEDEAMLRTREAETFSAHEADILIAPLMAIQRGFNILDEDEKGALLGTAYFLVRPYPPPEDLSPQIMSLNVWLLRQLGDNYRQLGSHYGSMGIEGMNELRQRAFDQWFRRPVTGQARIGGMDDDIYQEFIRDNFVNVWQTVGRLLRGGRDARVFFVDAAFSPEKSKRRMLRDWYTALDELMHLASPVERHLAAALYGTAHAAFQKAIEQQRIF